jgi:hypothetical protein
VGLFRRGEPLHERLAREGGLGDQPAELDPRPPTLETGIHGIQRPRSWDLTTLAEVEGLEGDEAAFVALPDGSLLVEEGPGLDEGEPASRPDADGSTVDASGPDTSLQPLAEVVEQELRTPYRARAVRRGDTLWAVQARRIEVLELPGVPNGETVDLTMTVDGSGLRVDGERVFGTVPALEERGAREGPEFTVHAERLDGDLWEVRAAPL